MQSVGVDVGGRFTDIAAVDSSGRLSIVKALSIFGAGPARSLTAFDSFH